MTIETKYQLGDKVVELSMSKDVLTVLSIQVVFNSVGQTITYRLESESGAQYTYPESRLSLIKQ